MNFYDHRFRNIILLIISYIRDVNDYKNLMLTSKIFKVENEKQKENRKIDHRCELIFSYFMPPESKKLIILSKKIVKDMYIQKIITIDRFYLQINGISTGIPFQRQIHRKDKSYSGLFIGISYSANIYYLYEEIGKNIPKWLELELSNIHINEYKISFTSEFRKL